MRLPVRYLLLFLLAPTLFAQVPPFGAPFPLSNTRYGTAPGVPLLRSDGRDAFLFWTDSQLRVTRLLPGEQHVGRPVFDLPVANSFDFDVVWTGAHFLVAAVVRDGSSYRIVGRIVESTGHPSGETFTIAANASQPRMAFDGRHVLLLYTSAQTSVRLLTPDGQPAGEEREISGFRSAPPALASNGERFAAILPDPDGAQLVLMNEQGAVVSTERLTSTAYYWTIASDGERFLAVSADTDKPEALLFDANGRQAGALVLDASDPLFYRNPDAAWTGSKWVVSYIAGTRDELRIAELDSVAASVVSRQSVAGVLGAVTTADGRIVASWSDNSVIYASELPLAPERVQPVSYAATQQRLLATATSATATLVVWQEYGNGRGSIRGGVRTRDGRWREREIALTASGAIAASDGREFVVILDDTVIRLDAEGQRVPFGFTRVVAFRPTGIAWNGRNFGLIGVDAGALRTALLTPAGVVTEAATLPFDQGTAAAPMIASNGNGFLAAWFFAPPCSPVDEFCTPKGLSGAHLNASVHATDPEPVVFAKDEAMLGAGVAWNGHRYAVAWSSATSGVAAAHLAASGIEKVILAKPPFALNVSVSPIGDAVAVGWTEDGDARVAIVNDNGNATAPVTIHREPTTPWSARLATFSDGTIQFIRSSIQQAAPHHGTSHVMMSVGSFALPPLPEAPRLTARRDDGVARLEWSAPPQRVSGYRVEYRVGDGVWNEVESWLDADRRSLLVNLPWPAATYTFRVRAWSDAGTGGYSQNAVVNPGRRRGVR